MRAESVFEPVPFGLSRAGVGWAPEEARPPAAPPSPQEPRPLRRPGGSALRAHTSGGILGLPGFSPRGGWVGAGEAVAEGSQRGSGEGSSGSQVVLA